jgi:hypothetical protein
MPPDVAAGSVIFGHTNTLDGDQFVSSFENALKTGEVQWWDSQAKCQRHDHLQLIHKSRKLILLVPANSTPSHE